MLEEDKDQLRERLRRRRAAVSPSQRMRAAEAAAHHLLALPEVTVATRVALYAAHGDELDPAPAALALRDRGAVTLLPRVEGDELVLVAVTSPTELVVGYRGIAEPVGDRVDASTVDVVVVPGVAFDRSGGRLGRGGGHYDRLLATVPRAVLRVGYGFACQLVEQVPRAVHDEPVDVLVTEEGTIRTYARS